MIQNMERAYNNLTSIKALEQVDEALAIQVLSDEALDGKELLELIETSMLGRVVNKDTGAPLKLSNKVLMAAVRTRFNQIEKENEANK